MPQNNRSLGRRIGEIALLVPIGIVAGVVFGALTNAVNGTVCPEYFEGVLHITTDGNSWGGPDPRWLAAMGEGVYEGFYFGIVLSLAYALVVGFISRLSAPLRVSFRGLLWAVGAVGAFWLAGGVNGVVLSSIASGFGNNPPVYFLRFSNDPYESWVGGSIQGIYWGMWPATIFGYLMFRRAWRRQKTGV